MLKLALLSSTPFYMRFFYTLLIGLLASSALYSQIKQDVIKGSDCNVIYQSFDAGVGGELQTIKISTDQIGLVTIKLFEDAKTFSSENPVWEINHIIKDQPGELIIDFDAGFGKTRTLTAGKKYSFSIHGAGNIHHSFLEDVYPGGNYRFEDGIERTGDLFFELEYEARPIESIQKKTIKRTTVNKNVITVFPNPTSEHLSFKGLIEKSEVNIFDSGGKLLLKKMVGPNENLSLNSLLDGAYYLSIKHAGEVTVKKIIKAKN